MNGFMVLFGLLGVVFCAFKIRSAWQGKSGVPIGTLLGGGLFGALGAGVGGAVAGDDDKKGSKPNIGGLIFWGLCGLVWLAITIGGFAAK
jgi:hypothetical protein